MDRPAAPGNFQVPSSTSTIPEGKQVVNTEEEYKQTNFYAPAQRRSMDQSRPRRSLSNGELENLDQPIYPVRCSSTSIDHLNCVQYLCMQCLNLRLTLDASGILWIKESIT